MNSRSATLEKEVGMKERLMDGCVKGRGHLEQKAERRPSRIPLRAKE